MNRQLNMHLVAGALGLSAVALVACGVSPTASWAGFMGVAQAADRSADDDLRAREARLEARERELQMQQEALRRERERLDEEGARMRGNRADASSGWYEADQSNSTSVAGSSIQRVATPPIMVPVGTPMQVELAANVDTKIARVGDRVEGRLAEDLVVDGSRRAAVAGAAVSGTVTELVSGSDRIGGVPTLALTFDSLEAANGATVPVVARFRQQAGSDTAEDAAKVIGGAAAGAVIGHQVGEDDRGTVIGGILGGAAGAAAAQKTGGEVKIRAGTVVTATTETSFSIY